MTGLIDRESARAMCDAYLAEIGRLHAENQRLRAALEEIAAEQKGRGITGSLTRRDLARHALGGGDRNEPKGSATGSGSSGGGDS